MFDIFTQFSWLLALVFFGLQGIIFIGLFLWTIWTDTISPSFISKDEIKRAVNDIIENYEDPEKEAFDRHERAWHGGDGEEQAYWKRVRKAIRRQLNRI